MLALILVPFIPSGTSHLYSPGGPSELRSGLLSLISCSNPLLLKLNASAGRGTIVLFGKNQCPTNPPYVLLFLSLPLQQSVLTLVVTHTSADPGLVRPYDIFPMSLMRTESPGKYMSYFCMKYRPIAGGATAKHIHNSQVFILIKTNDNR